MKIPIGWLAAGAVSAALAGMVVLYFSHNLIFAFVGAVVVSVFVALVFRAKCKDDRANDELN